MAEPSEDPKTKPAKPRTTKPKSAAKPAAKSTAAKAAASKPAAPRAAAKPRTRAAKPKPAETAPAPKPAPEPAPIEAKASPDTGQNSAASQSPKEHSAHVDRVWTLARQIGICMFVTWDGERQRARPLAAHVEREANAIYFLTDLEGHKDEQVKQFPIVTLAFADKGGAKYVAITGHAEISNDRKKIREIFTPFAKAWWESAEDPSIRLIKVRPQDAELWDSPGRLASTVGMLAAAVTGKTPRIGENAKVEL